MRLTYRIIAYVISALVALQAASHAWASAGISLYLSEGGALDMTADGPPPFPEFAGIIIHGMNGMFVIPLVALALLIVSFFAKVPHGVTYAAVVLGLVVLQVVLGLFGHGLPFLAFLHGVNALLIFGTALIAGLRAKDRSVAPAETPAATTGAAV